MCDQALFNKEQITKDMENSIITPELYLGTLQSIKDKVDFK